MLNSRSAVALLLVLFTALVHAESPRVEQFTPRGTVKNVRQASASFATSMVPFGEPLLPDPFAVSCPVKGSGRWIDDRTWVYDFARDLPAGLHCSFRSVDGLADLAGQSLDPAAYSFSTGGPAVVESIPYQGSEGIDEEQIFILGLDAAATERTVLDHAWCDVAGLGERVPVRLVTGADRASLMDAQRGFVERHLRRYFRPGGKPYRKTDWQRARDLTAAPIALVQCQRRLPSDAKVRLVWGAGIAAATGVANAKDQVLAFKTRPAFRARLTCQRVNRTAPCIPVLPMTLSFSAPVSRAEAEKIILRGADGIYPASMEEGTAFFTRLTFKGPFPEKATFKLELPAGLQDDAGRPLANAASFPLTVRTDENPPLAKFAARFGIVEANAGALLPVTVRDIASKTPASGTPAIDGRIHRANASSVADLIGWMRRLKSLDGNEWRYDEKTRKNVLVRRAGERSIFAKGEANSAFQVPRSAPVRSMEVIGIPLERPGFYVVELASPRLGAALLGKTQPYYVQAAALVTNLAVHLKLGRESSLVWVTTLDRGEPVSGAEVTVADCGGRTHFTGTTDTQGLLRIGQALPAVDTLPGCLDSYDKAYIVTARMKDDAGFVLSTWNEGIAPWRFNLPEGSWQGPIAATTVFDRTLLRAGETVHMKHFVRRHTERGLEFVATDALASRIVIRHEGSDDRYEVPVTWDAKGIAESSWTIPKEAKQSVYGVSMLDRLVVTRGGPPEQERRIGSFRVEAFRVPTMKAVLVPPKMPLVHADAATFDVQVSFLSGGGAALLPARMRGLIEPKSVSFPGYDGFIFANGDIKEGVRESGVESWEPGESSEDADEAESPDEAQTPGDARRIVAGESLTLDDAGGGRFTLKNLPRFDTPQSLIAELEYPDPNGERLTASTRVPLWPAHVLVGLKLDSWVAARERLKFQALVVDTSGRPVAGRRVQVDLLQSKSYSHRKRLIGGFYAYDSVTEVKRIGWACEGKTDQLGLLACDIKSLVSGNVVLRAKTQDESGNVSYANRDAWVAGKDDWWFDQKDGDRMDVLPERKRYEPGESARFQVRMPFRQAQALVTVEREGVIEGFVTRLDGREPVVDVPITGSYAPNVFVSVLAVRGRVTDVQPTSMVDLGKPAFRLGIAEITVGYRAHELAVSVKPEREVYRVREKARVTVSVSRADGSKLREGSEIALAAVDEGLLELLPNESWNLLESMLQRRGIEVDTATAQMEVIGKRHFGRKALPTGGGGGRLNARELFETLLLWRGRVQLDANGRAQVEVPLNDSLTSFRIVAVADASAGLFGTGDARIRTTQDLMLISGLAPVVRDGDKVVNVYTVRNASDQPLTVEVTPKVQALDAFGKTLPSPRLGLQRVTLARGAAKEMTSELAVPTGAVSLAWEISAQDSNVASAKDALKLTQRVVPAVEVTTLQATIKQIEGAFNVPVQIPAGAEAGRGGVRVTLSPKLAADLPGVRDYMTAYPYTCFEQRASQAIALRDRERWARVLESLPAHLDGDGLAKYFPTMGEGSDVLTAYLLAVSHEAGWRIPEELRARMAGGLAGFVQGRVTRDSGVGAADLVLRKIAALEALSRYDAKLSPRLLDSIRVEPNLWPTSALIDWISLLGRMESAPDRRQSLIEARGILRARMSLQGTVLGFATERQDRLWWLMASPDANANRALLLLMNEPAARGDMARLGRGALMRQRRGHWDTTVANAWGVLAFERFAQRFEPGPVTGLTRGALGGNEKSLDWSARHQGGDLDFEWPRAKSELVLTQVGTGKPWATIASRAAVPLAAPVASGMRVTRTVAPVERKFPGVWSRGDIARVRIELVSDVDMSWVVVSDPIPAGAMILGGGLGGDSRIATSREREGGYTRPAFEERGFETYRAYYAFVPKGRWSVEYTVRLNNAGRFEMPPTRVEALYAPEVFGAAPNAAVEVRP